MTTPVFHSADPLVTGIDPRLLAAQDEANAFLAQMPRLDVRTPEGLALLRATTANNAGDTVLTPTDHTIPGPGGGLALRIFTPDVPVRAAMLRIHGGGWAAGAPEDDDVLNDRLARACGIAVISPGYRLTPEATIADQIADTLAAADWLAEHSAARFGTEALLIGGISAGAHLAAATLLALRDTGHPAYGRVLAACLDCGAYDLGGTPSALTATDDTLVLRRELIDGLLETGLPGLSADQRRAPELSPALADLPDLPPALFTVGGLDPLRDDSLLMAARWQLAGNRADLDVWPRAAHAFTNMATPLGDLAFTRTADWISDVLDRSRDAADAAEPAEARPADVVRRFIDEVVNGGDLTALDELWAEDLSWYGGSLGEYHGIEEFRKNMAANAVGAFTGMHLHIDELLSTGDKVVARFTNSGTQTGPFLGRPASGKHAAWLGIGIYTVADGKISEAWFGEDILGLLIQLGAVQLPAS
jgi:acetyl esterase/lipase/predicted ester cyclase